MSQVKTRRDALKLSFGVLVGLPAVSALNACTQCSKPSAETTSAPDAAATAQTDAGATATTEATTAGTPAAGDTTAAAGGETLTLVSETDPVASGLNYKHDKSAVPANLQQAKDTIPFAEQSCATCVFYKAAGQLDGGEVGSCQVIAAGKVKAGGWCSSWGKKA